MKNQLRIVFALVLCIFICQTNVEGQIFKKALSKVKGAVSSVTGGKVSVPSGPAKPDAPNVKNGISDIRSYTGLTKEAFMTKIKGQGYVAGTDQDAIGLSGEIYKSKATGYYLAVEYGTRKGATYVRDIYKAKATKSPSLPTIKKSYLDYGKQCTDVKAKFQEGVVESVTGSKIKAKAKNTADWTSKYLPTLDKIINAKEMCIADQTYDETCYRYYISLQYRLGVAIVTVRVIDLTLEGQEG